MPHETALIATIAAGLGLAFVFGFIAIHVRLPPLVGYLVAGIVVGPFTPGFVADTELAPQLAEVGVILLMFGVGIHFSLADLLAARRIALPGAIVQITVATLLGAVVSHLWGWSWGAGIVFGLCLSVASTVVLLRALEDRQMLDTDDGRIAVGWLIVEDLVTVLVLVLLPALVVPLGGTVPDAVAAGEAASPSLLVTIGITLAKVAAFVVLMLVVGSRAVPWLLERVARTGSRELFTLSVLAVALGIAVGAAALFGVSFALGAFFAGMVVNGSDLSHEAATEALPLQDAFSVLFFVAVGMLFDPAILISQPLEILAVVLIVMLGKSLAAFFIVLALRYTVTTALTISASLAQIGEFSFILAALAVTLGILPAEGQSLIVACALISITLNPLSFAITTRTCQWLATRPCLMSLLERPAGAVAELPATVAGSSLRDHVVLVGFGRVGSVIGETLAQQGIQFIAVEQNLEAVEAFRARGVPILYGDAARPGVLRQASIEHARLLVVATPEPYQIRAIIKLAREVNPTIDTVARTHSEGERTYLLRQGVGLALIGEHELALGLAHSALVRMGCDDDDADEIIDALRRGTPSKARAASASPTGDA
jgi:CPA2 family monovalent cation:H+ antiporter-2